MTRLRRQLSFAVLFAAIAASAQNQSSTLPSAPQPQVDVDPAPQNQPAPAQNQPAPEKKNEKPAPLVFEDLSPRKPQPPPNSSAPAQDSSAQAPATNSQSNKGQTTKPDPVGEPGASTQQDAAKPPAQNSTAKPQSNAGDDQPDENGNQAKFTTETREVDVVFTVTDKHGRFIKNLTREDFKVLDNKKPPARVLNFAAQTDLPLRVGLLVDASGSIRERFRFEQETAAEFLASIIRPKVDKAFVVGFDSNPEVTQDFTNNPELLSKGVHMLRPGGGTALYDAIYQACRKKLWHTGDNEAVRKAIIVVSDGDDNQSTITREEAIEMAQRAEVIIYTISTNNSGTLQKGDEVLGQIASATGGRAFFPFKLEDLSNAFNDVQEELRSQYSVSYVPAEFNLDGSFHSIEIVVDNKKYKARARRGYFAQRIARRPGNSGK
jgi:Ca-activated chloride channel homolog